MLFYFELFKEFRFLSNYETEKCQIVVAFYAFASFVNKSVCCSTFLLDTRNNVFRKRQTFSKLVYKN